MQAMQWQNGIIITSGLLLWRLCMPGERHSQTPSVDTEQPTLASEWSRGNIRQLSRLFWPVSDDNITPCNTSGLGEPKVNNTTSTFSLAAHQEWKYRMLVKERPKVNNTTSTFSLATHI